jgi:hypothetical protein
MYERVDTAFGSLELTKGETGPVNAREPDRWFSAEIYTLNLAHLQIVMGVLGLTLVTGPLRERVFSFAI